MSALHIALRKVTYYCCGQEMDYEVWPRSIYVCMKCGNTR